MSVRHEWYQTDQKIVISVQIKNATEKNCKVDIQTGHVVVTGDNDIHLKLDLLNNINTDGSGYKISPYKIEITLKKWIGIFWPTLIKTDTPTLPTTSMATVEQSANGNVADAKTTVKPKDHKEWDKLANEMFVKEELDKEKDELNSLFQQIYSNSNPEVQRAMNKSFSESGGTVLSTNWDEVKQKTVEIKPPEGLEYRKWEE